MSVPALPPGQVELFLPPTRAIFQPLWGKPRAEREECLSTSPPLEAAVPQNEVYHRRCWLAPRSKKMRLQDEADFCQGHFGAPVSGFLLVVHFLCCLDHFMASSSWPTGGVTLPRHMLSQVSTFAQSLLRALLQMSTNRRSKQAEINQRGVEPWG